MSLDIILKAVHTDKVRSEYDLLVFNSLCQYQHLMLPNARDRFYVMAIRKQKPARNLLAPANNMILWKMFPLFDEEFVDLLVFLQDSNKQFQLDVNHLPSVYLESIFKYLCTLVSKGNVYSLTLPDMPCTLSVKKKTVLVEQLVCAVKKGNVAFLAIVPLPWNTNDTSDCQKFNELFAKVLHEQQYKRQASGRVAKRLRRAQEI